MPTPKPPSIPQPGGQGMEGQVGASGPDGQWTWRNGGWVWQPTGGGSTTTSVDAANVGSSPTGVDVGKATGVVPNYVSPGSPGGSVDTGQSDDDKQRMAQLIAQLQQQATTGDGSWQKALATSTRNAQGAASAVGQSERAQAQSGAAGSLRDINNAEAGVSQRAAGQGNTLRAQAQQGAQDELSTTLGQQDAQEANLAGDESAVAQQNVALNKALQEQATSAQSNLQSGITQGTSFLSYISSGGRVPGRPKVFGDSETNDTVPAMLSPGEIVVPRTKARDPQAAADFAAAVARKHGKHLAGGGTPDSPDTGTQVGIGALSFLLPPAGTIARQAWMQGHGVGREDPTVANGGLLNTADYDATRDASLANQNLIAQRAAGAGPSVVPQEMTNAQDASVAAGLSAGRRTPASAAVQGAAMEASGRGANAAKTALGEQQGASSGLASAILAQRQNDIALAEMKQQAAFRNTEMNAGLSLANQAAVRAAVSAGGQAATAFTGTHNVDDGSRGGGGDEVGDTSSAQTHDLGDITPPDLGGGGDEVGDTSSAQTHDQPGFSMGGIIRGMANGGVADSGMAQMLEKARHYHAPAPVAPRDSGPLELHPPQPQSQTWELFDPAKTSAAQSGYPEYTDTTISAEDPVVIPRRDVRHGLDSQGWTTRLQPIGSPATQKPVERPPEVPSSLAMRTAAFVDALRKQAAGAAGLAAGPMMERSVEPKPVAAKEAPKAVPLPVAEEPGAIDEFQVQRARGGSIPEESLGQRIARAGRRYAEGGGVADAEVQPTTFTPGMPADAGTSAIPQASFPQRGIQGLDMVGPTGQVIPWEKSIEGMPPPAPKAAPRPPPEMPKTTPKARPSLAQAFERAAINPEAPVAAPPSPEEAVGAIKAEEATKLAGLAQENEERAAAYQRDLRMSADKSAARADELLAVHRAAIDEMSKPLSVDTGRFWATRSTAQKISGIIGMALGAFGTGPDGINKSVALLQQSVDRDIDAQKAEHTIRLQQSRARAEGYQTLYSQAHEMTGDDVSAKKLAFAAGMDIAAAKAERVAQETNNPLAKQQAMMLARDARMKADAARADTRLKLAEADFHEAQAGKLQHAGGASKVVSPGYQLRGDVAPRPEELSKWREARTTHDVLQGEASELSRLINANGTMLTGVNSGRAEEIVAHLTAKLKDMEALGALSGSDYALLSRQIPDPTDWKSLGTRNGTMTAKLKQFQDTLTKTFGAHTNSLGIVPTAAPSVDVGFQ